MAKWHSLLEYVQFPLKVLFFGTILLGIGSSIINPNVDPFLWHIENEYVIAASELMRYSGGMLIHLFPLLVFIKALSRKFEDSVPVFVGFFGYIILTITVMFFINTQLPSYFYESTLGIEVSFGAESVFGEGTRSPYLLGIVSLILVYFITKKSYERSRHHSMHGVLSFLDHDSWAMLSTFVFCVIAGLLISFIWPYIVDFILSLYAVVGRDITNPLNLFFYGILERVSAIFNMVEIPRNLFWFGDLGGSFMETSGVKHIGDVSIWTYQISNSLDLTAGRFITPYYVINMFVMPSFLLGYLSLVTSKKDCGRYLLFFIIAIIFSIVCGNALPMEILMLVLAPLLYFVYILLVGALFAIFQIMDISLGYNFSDLLMMANPGSLLDIVQFFRNPQMVSALSGIAIVGVCSFIFFFLATRSYFKTFAIGLLQITNRKKVTKRIVTALGGIDNILSIDSTPDKLTVGLRNREILDFDTLKSEGAYLVLASKEGYLIRLGNISTIVAKEIRHMMKEQSEKPIEPNIII